MVGLPSAPYASATAPLTTYLIPLQLPVVTPVLHHNPRLAAASERPVTARYDERVVGVALLNSVLLSKVRSKTSERKPAIGDVIRETPPHGGHECLAHELLRLFELFLEPLPVQPLVALLVQKSKVVSAIATALRAKTDMMEVDLLTRHRLAAQLADTLLPHHNVSLRVDVAEHRALLVSDTLNVGVHRSLNVELPCLDDSPCYRDQLCPHPPKVEVRQVLALDGGRILPVPVPAVVETLFPVPKSVSPLSSVHRPFCQPSGRWVSCLAVLLLQRPPEVFPSGLLADYGVSDVAIPRVDTERHFRRVFCRLVCKSYRERVVADDRRPPAADHSFGFPDFGRRERRPVPVEDTRVGLWFVVFMDGAVPFRPLMSHIEAASGVVQTFRFALRPFLFLALVLTPTVARNLWSIPWCVASASAARFYFLHN